MLCKPQTEGSQSFSTHRSRQVSYLLLTKHLAKVEDLCDIFLITSSLSVSRPKTIKIEYCNFDQSPKLNDDRHPPAKIVVITQPKMVLAKKPLLFYFCFFS